MDDLIRRSAVIDAIRGEREYLIARKQLNAEHILAHHFDAIMDDIPAVDAVEVVRCPSCFYHIDDGYHECMKLRIRLPDDAEFFCKYGQRREDGLYESLKRGLEEAIAYENGEIECRTETRGDGDA